MGPVEALVRSFSIMIKNDPATTVYDEEDTFYATLGDAVRKGNISKTDAAALTSALRKAEEAGTKLTDKSKNSIRLDKDVPSPEENIETPVVEKDEEKTREPRAKGGRSLDDDQ